MTTFLQRVLRSLLRNDKIQKAFSDDIAAVWSGDAVIRKSLEATRLRMTGCGGIAFYALLSVAWRHLHFLRSSAPSNSSAMANCSGEALEASIARAEEVLTSRPWVAYKLADTVPLCISRSNFRVSVAIASDQELVRLAVQDLSQLAPTQGGGSPVCQPIVFLIHLDELRAVNADLFELVKHASDRGPLPVCPAGTDNTVSCPCSTCTAPLEA